MLFFVGFVVDDVVVGVVVVGGQSPGFALKTFPDKKDKVRAPRGALQSKKHKVHRPGGINNYYSLEMRIQQQQQSF